MDTLSSVGKARRLDRLLVGEKRRAVLVPVDDSLISGPFDGLQDLRTIANSLSRGRPDSVIAFGGFLRLCHNELGGVPTILNITASTLRSGHTHKRAVGGVADAVAVGADAVAVHANIGSANEGDMLVTIARTARECEHYGLPLLAIMYPRTEGGAEGHSYDDLRRENPEEYGKLVAHACRVGLELGADLVKTQYTGTPASFRGVVEACAPIPVVVAGGPALPPREAFELARGALSVGAAGVSFGRNVFSRPSPTRWIEALRMVVHDGASVDAATAYVDNQAVSDGEVRS